MVNLVSKMIEKFWRVKNCAGAMPMAPMAPMPVGWGAAV
eukprot:SAG22_NODE_9267_length_599_cov_1.856000_2_plen_38_part_01